MKTNIEVITEFMTYGSPLQQAFVIEALSRYANEVVEKADSIRESMKNSFIHPDAWIGCAEAWHELAKREALG